MRFKFPFRLHRGFGAPGPAFIGMPGSGISHMVRAPWADEAEHRTRVRLAIAIAVAAAVIAAFVFY